MLRRLAVPADGLRVVLRNASSICIHDAEIGLGESIALLRRLAVPAEGLGVVLRNTFPVFITHA